MCGACWPPNGTPRRPTRRLCCGGISNSRRRSQQAKFPYNPLTEKQKSCNSETSELARYLKYFERKEKVSEFR